MKLSKEDRNTALTIAIVLAVCMVTLIAIGSVLIQLITPGVNIVTSFLGSQARLVVDNYNFAIPEATSGQVAAVTTSSTTSLAPRLNTSEAPTLQRNDSNFTQAVAVAVNYKQVPTNQSNFTILNDFRPTIYEDESQIEFQIQIPLANVFTAVVSSANRQDLSQKMWTPTFLGRIVVCDRVYANKSSCHELDKLQVGDELILWKGSYFEKYSVTGFGTYSRSNSLVFEPVASNQLKLITTSTQDPLDKRLVVLFSKME